MEGCEMKSDEPVFQLWADRAPSRLTSADCLGSALRSALSAPPDTAPRKNAALRAKDRNQPTQRLHRQKQQEGEYRYRSPLLTLSPLEVTFQCGCLFELRRLSFMLLGCLSCSVLEKWTPGDV